VLTFDTKVGAAKSPRVPGPRGKTGASTLRLMIAVGVASTHAAEVGQWPRQALQNAGTSATVRMIRLELESGA
jgi:hypothetical protein